MFHKSVLLFVAFGTFLGVSVANAAFVFGLHPEFNDTDEIVTLEKQYGFHSSAVGYIFDTF